MQGIRKTGVVVLSLLTLLATVLGVYEAIHSSLFLVQVVEVDTDTQAGPDSVGAANGVLNTSQDTSQDPLSAETISDLAAVPIGKANLFSLDLAQVEARILANEWVRAVTLQKRFPQTLAISVEYRKPLALVQSADGSLAYLDRDAKPFGKVNLSYQPDLPILVGAWTQHTHRLGVPDLAQGLALLDRWNGSPVGHFAQLSSLAWEPERGFHAIAVYRLKTGGRIPTLSRAVVDLGPQSQEADAATFDRLGEVFRYLRDNSVSARQIWADAGKKIVVKTARGS